MDKDLETILESTLKGDMIKKLSLFTKIAYEECKEQFGQKEQTGKNLPSSPSRRERENLTNFKGRWKKAPEHRKSALQHSCKDVLARLLELTKAEKLWKK